MNHSRAIYRKQSRACCFFWEFPSPHLVVKRVRGAKQLRTFLPHDDLNWFRLYPISLLLALSWTLGSGGAHKEQVQAHVPAQLPGGWFDFGVCLEGGGGGSLTLV